MKLHWTVFNPIVKRLQRIIHIYRTNRLIHNSVIKTTKSLKSKSIRNLINICLLTFWSTELIWVINIMLLSHAEGIILWNSVSKMRSFLMLNMVVYIFTTLLERVNCLVFSFLWDFRCILSGPFAMPFMNFAEKPFKLIFRNVSKAELNYIIIIIIIIIKVRSNMLTNIYVWSYVFMLSWKFDNLGISYVFHLSHLMQNYLVT